MDVARGLQDSGNQVVVKREDIFLQYMPTKAGDPLKFDWEYKTFAANMDITYLIPTEELQFRVEIPNNSYISLGFGTDMFNVDMITWHGLGEASKSVDYFSKGKYEPGKDPSDK